jgi:hypothetical protein
MTALKYAIFGVRGAANFNAMATIENCRILTKLRQTAASQLVG